MYVEDGFGPLQWLLNINGTTTCSAIGVATRK